MEVETVLKITEDFKNEIAKGANETLCLLAVRHGNLGALSELLQSRTIAKEAIARYEKLKEKDFKEFEEVFK